MTFADQSRAKDNVHKKLENCCDFCDRKHGRNLYQMPKNAENIQIYQKYSKYILLIMAECAILKSGKT